MTTADDFVGRYVILNLHVTCGFGEGSRDGSLSTHPPGTECWVRGVHNDYFMVKFNDGTSHNHLPRRYFHLPSPLERLAQEAE